MSPTRRDLLKGSTGLVAASLVSVPVVAQPDPVYIESIVTVMVHAKLSDGRLATLGQARLEGMEEIATLVTVDDGQGGAINHFLDLDLAEPIHWGNARFIVAALRDAGMEVTL
jgi:hypothetical protein